MDLPFTLEYNSTTTGYLAAYEAVNGIVDWRWWKRLDRGFAISQSLPLLVYLLAAIQERNTFLLCIVVITGLFLVQRLRTLLEWQRSQFENSLAQAAGKEIRLEFTESGLIEHESGISTSADWSAVRGFWNHRETLCIQLANRCWAIIPAETLPPSELTLDRIEEVLLKLKVTKNSRIGRAPASRTR
jgi:hypothetical protein